MQNNIKPQRYSTTYQLKLPLEISTIIEVSDPVYTFCEVMDHIDLRKYLVTEENKAPSFMTIDNFMNNCLLDNIDNIFAEINQYIFSNENADINHVYIDGTKIVANANKYSWVWKKSCIKKQAKDKSDTAKVTAKYQLV